MTAGMHRLPLLFTFKNRVEGRGFLAEVEAQGRVLSMCDFGRVWMYGVQPGGIAASGESKSESYAAFKNAYTSVLLDIASEAKDFPTFECGVKEFFNDVCCPMQDEWWEAVEQVKKEKYEEEGLRKKSAEKTEMRIAVRTATTVKKATPESDTVDTENVWPEQVLLAA